MQTPHKQLQMMELNLGHWSCEVAALPDAIQRDDRVATVGRLEIKHWWIHLLKSFSPRRSHLLFYVPREHPEESLSLHPPSPTIQTSPVQNALQYLALESL